MPGYAKKFVRVTKFLLAGMTVFCVSWIASVGEWHGGVRWRARGVSHKGVSTMRTIVAYSEGKLAELEQPSVVTCDRLPAYPDIPYINHTWSRGAPAGSLWQRVAGTRVSLYNAFYDERAPRRSVRILATFEGRKFSIEQNLYCQIRLLNPYEDSVEVVAAIPLEIWAHTWDTSSLNIETPLLLSCPLTEPLYGPSVVSIVTQPCEDSTNAFFLQPTQTIYKHKRTFTICVKDMTFDKDISQNLVEWIETNRILGVEMIDIYVDNISARSENVLMYYRNKGYVRLFHVPITSKPKRSLWQRRRDHIITYNDCLYRNIYESEFIVPLDIDEIVLPKIAYTLPELLKRLRKYDWDPSKHSAILIHNVFFFDFMQKIRNYKQKNVRRHKRKLYIKRDDVRILYSTNSLRNKIIGDTGVEKQLYLEYESRCGKELPVPKLAQSIVSSAVVSPIRFYSKSLMATQKVLTAFNHYPLVSLGEASFAAAHWAAPFSEVQLNHYKESCNNTVMTDCAWYGRRARVDLTALRLRADLTRALAKTICT